MNMKDIIPWRRRGDGGLQRPFEELRAVAESMERAFEDFWAPVGAGGPGFPLLRAPGLMPAGINVKETAKEVIVSAALPGVDKKDIHVELAEDRLTITAEHEDKAQRGGGRRHIRRERSYSRYHHSFTLPAAVRVDKAKAGYKDGMLRLELPKVKESQVRRIDIE